MKLVRYIILVVLLSSFSNFLAWAEINKKEAFSNFISAGMDYKDGKYQDAISKYEAILRSGVESGPIYYNLANSYFKAGKLGKAVLNYDRARLFMPRDSDVNYNYRYALSKANIDPKEKGKGFWGEKFSQFVDQYTISEMVCGILILFVVFFVCHMVILSFRIFPQKKVGIFVVFSFMIAVMAFLLSVKVHNLKGLAVVVIPSSANFEPREDSTKHFDLPEGSHVKIVKDEFDWYKIKRPDGKMGWVRAKALEKVRQ